VTVKDLVRPIPGVRQLSSIRQRLGFNGSTAFWEQRYARGGTSGEGSYGDLAAGKARFLNAFVRNNAVQTVIELGCGDGNQLSLSAYPQYVGLDVSKTAIKLCKSRFADDPSKSFFLYDSSCFVDRAGLFTADLALSLDVIYHLVEDPAAKRCVVIYATNDAISGGAPHVRHRRFSAWVEANRPEWELKNVSRGPGSGHGRPDFFVYARS
jgi:SAM-dependent methyltransferase